jgi:hypothetical protein
LGRGRPARRRSSSQPPPEQSISGPACVRVRVWARARGAGQQQQMQGTTRVSAQAAGHTARLCACPNATASTGCVCGPTGGGGGSAATNALTRCAARCATRIPRGRARTHTHTREALTDDGAAAAGLVRSRGGAAAGRGIALVRLGALDGDVVGHGHGALAAALADCARACVCVACARVVGWCVCLRRVWVGGWALTRVWGDECARRRNGAGLAASRGP